MPFFHYGCPQDPPARSESEQRAIDAQNYYARDTQSFYGPDSIIPCNHPGAIMYVDPAVVARRRVWEALAENT